MTFSEGTLKIDPLTLDRALVTDKSNNFIQVQLDTPMGLLVFLTGIWVIGYLQEHTQLKAAASLSSIPQHG